MGSDRTHAALRGVLNRLAEFTALLRKAESMMVGRRTGIRVRPLEQRFRELSSYLPERWDCTCEACARRWCSTAQSGAGMGVIWVGLRPHKNSLPLPNLGGLARVWQSRWRSIESADRSPTSTVPVRDSKCSKSCVGE